MHPEAKAALIRKILRLVSNTLSEEDRAIEYEKLYVQLLRNRIWKWKFSKEFLDNEIQKLLDRLQGVKDAGTASEHLDQLIAQLDNTSWNLVVEIAEHDYHPLENFRLKWRWTDARWNLLPSDVLANIRPLAPVKAVEVNDKTSVFHPDKGFLPGTYRLADEIETKHEDAQRVRDWLQLHIPSLEERVIVCWNFNDAVVTTAAIFCDYWDDFCYPGSDDASISPFSGEWIFCYWHEKVFFFGQRCES